MIECALNEHAWMRLIQFLAADWPAQHDGKCPQVPGVVGSDELRAVRGTAGYETSRKQIVGDVGAILFEAPTGTGKTLMAGHVAAEFPVLCEIETQLFAKLRREPCIEQCPSCQRILFYVPPAPAPTPEP